MNRTALWRYLLIILLVALGTIYALPNLFGEDYAVQITRLGSVTEKVATLSKAEFTKKIESILANPSVKFPQGITAKRIIINTKEEGNRNVIDGDPVVLFSNGKEQEQALSQLQAQLPQDRYSVAMTMATRTPGWLTALGAKPMTLGLDLRGGIHFLLRVDVKSLMDNQLTNDQIDIVNTLMARNSSEPKIYYQKLSLPRLIDSKSLNGEYTFVFQFSDQNYVKNPFSRLQEFARDYEITKDDAKKTVTMKFRDSTVKQKTEQAMTRNIQTLTGKINRLGVSEPSIQRQGKYNISVDLPGVQDVARARAAIGTVAKVELHMAKPMDPSPSQTCSDPVFTKAVLYKDPSGTTGENRYVCINPEVALPGRAIDDARADSDRQTGMPQVAISASGSAVSKFRDITSKNIGNPLATVYSTTQEKTHQVSVDGVKVIFPANKDQQAAVTQSIDALSFKIKTLHDANPIDSDAEINVATVGQSRVASVFGIGDFNKTVAFIKKNLSFKLAPNAFQRIEKTKNKTFSVQVETVISVARIQSTLGRSFVTTFGIGQMPQAIVLAKQLRSGAYAAPVAFVAQQKLGPSMGKQNIDKGVFSCLIGSLLVILFMAIYYRVFGLVANLALILNVIFVVALMSIIGATMTVPGIAGIILTVGMAVDANVLINERIREELRLGVSTQAAIKAGYDRAFSTIVDANVTTLLVACVLYGLGSGTVKGFAVTLTIGLITSMFTSIFFTRALVNLIYGNRRVKQLSIGIKVK